MVEGKYVNIQAEIQASTIFHMRDIRGTMYRNSMRFVWRRHVGVYPDVHEHEERKPT